MSGDNWLDQNNQYLAASLEWLRLRLERVAPPPPPLVEVKAPPQEPVRTAPQPPDPNVFKKLLHIGSGKEEAAVPKPLTLLPEAKQPPYDDQIKLAAEKRAAAAKIDPPPALVMLAERFAMSDFERDTLLLCASMEFDPNMGLACALAQNNPARAYPTFALALATLDDPSWDALSPHRPPRFARLVEIAQPGGAPLTASPLRGDERVVNYIKGLNTVDDRLTGLLRPLGAVDPKTLAKGQQANVAEIRERLRQAASQSAVPVVQLVGSDPWSRAAVGQTVCDTLNRKLYRLGVESLPSQPGDIELLARLWQRESILLGVALYVDAEGAEGAPAESSGALARFLSQPLGLVFVGVRDTPLRIAGESFTVEIEDATAAEQYAAWKGAFEGHGEAKDIDSIAATLAGQFRLNLHDIAAVAHTAIESPGGDAELRRRVWEGCKELTRPRLDQLAQRLDAKARWEDLVLPDEQMYLMRQIAGQVRERYRVYEEWGFTNRMNRGFGISALFAGESGTGKTMAAEVIANDLGLNLYRIDLSAVVSKYIGETEKNLRRLFDAAEQGGAVLLFDEADALFGKRSEVKDSHDRYANIEINYLLQRMESFSGLAILATNMKTALDPAFMRRLRFIVNFPFPGVAERKRIWQQALPPETPSEGLDYDRLARLTVTGGNIHSIALNAAFAAAQSGRAVTMPVTLSAARMEMRKLDKPIHEGEFR
jgi:ATPase family protein associated with various cellular activities (AAA)/winged helix domain-containing protein